MTVEATARNALPVGFLLMEYRITSVLGAGAFGVTYLAHDVNLEKDTAIKEYMPGGIAARTGEGQVVASMPDQEETFRWGRDRFITEARTLAKLHHPHIVRVTRYFEAYGTAYMVMDHERGESLKSLVARRGPIPEGELQALVGPLLDGLQKVHDEGYLHRDIKPDNILVREKGGLVLLDFGSARRALPDADKALTAIVSPGYAPVEQYSEAHAQGPWSDLYALGGVLYFAVTGHRPPDSLARMKSDTVRAGLDPARGMYSDAFIDAIAWALSWDDSARPRTIAAWRAALLDGGALPHDTLALDAEATVRIAAGSSAPAERTVRIDAPDAGLARPRPDGSAGATLALATGPLVPGRTGDWMWAAPYVGVALVALVLAWILGGMELFEKTMLVRSRSWLERLLTGGGRQELTAAQLVRAIGYAGALAVLWPLAKRAGAQLLAGDGKWASLGPLLLPLATLFVVPGVYAALLPVAEALLDASAVALYNWAFALGTALAGVWLAFGLFRRFGALTALRRPGASDAGPSSG